MDDSSKAITTRLPFNIGDMKNTTHILSKIESGDPSQAEELLPLVYDELRALAGDKMARERPGQTIQATELVHEAYCRLVDVEQVQHWNSRSHFFAAAAEAMRRILVERARKKKRLKHSGAFQRIETELIEKSDLSSDVVVVGELIEQLEHVDSEAATIAKMRFFAGFTIKETAGHLGVSTATVNREWAFARSWLETRLADKDTTSGRR